MVLAQRVGKERSFLRGFLLSIATVGFYSVYWNYRAHNEIYRQFELAREERDEGVVWFLLGLVFPPLVFAYLWIFVSNVAYVRQRMLLPQRTTPRAFVGLVAAALGAFLLATIAATVATEAAPAPAEGETAEVAPAVAVQMLLFGVAALVAFAAVAYAMLQRDINEIWRAYDARVREIGSRPPVGRIERAPDLSPHPSTWVEVSGAVQGRSEPS